MDCLTHLMLFEYSMLIEYYILHYLSSLIVCCCFPGDMYLFIFFNWIFISLWSISVSVISGSEALPDTVSVIVSSMFLLNHQFFLLIFELIYFDTVFSASGLDCLAWLRGFWLYLPLKFLLAFLLIFHSCF